jgi:hypothetical protein
MDILYFVNTVTYRGCKKNLNLDKIEWRCYYNPRYKINISKMIQGMLWIK